MHFFSKNLQCCTCNVAKLPNVALQRCIFLPQCCFCNVAPFGCNVALQHVSYLCPVVSAICMFYSRHEYSAFFNLNLGIFRDKVAYFLYHSLSLSRAYLSTLENTAKCSAVFVAFNFPSFCLARPDKHTHRYTHIPLSLPSTRSIGPTQFCPLSPFLNIFLLEKKVNE